MYFMGVPTRGRLPTFVSPKHLRSLDAVGLTFEHQLAFKLGKSHP
jgi:hypothetical protein